ncbi:MAG: transcription-repair coupling factor [Methylococcaceae bacterium]|nr:transcription-repair coupling factor [Methylococcaceae bacterium]MDZ4155917.1 transcription-repair coupling factor [Methylococcales bacterium]MDP2392294.1 transcription-repair coupling factor [Methylococcaceae bacterium]MDP3019026.1 transcription-repair coupling factor [Methylococcaceae bacterium]MDP3391588.1 transcription-repair coupling factor [Methylococcaceae bacterium]
MIFSPQVPNKKDQQVTWAGLSGCGDALALASAIKNENRLFIIVTPDNQTALRLEHELAFFLDSEYPILQFPDWETLPYDVFSPLPEIISERLKTLALLPQVKRGALVVSVATLMHRLAPREHVLANSFSIKLGDQFNLELNRIKLESVGYHCVSQVYQHGEFAVRGAIVDLFPMGSKVPFRIELFDEDIDSIRTFDPETQLSLEKIEQIQLFPAREFPFTDEAIKHFRQAFREYFPQASPKNTLYTDVSKGITPGGIEYYLPLFVDQKATLFDYLPTSATMVTTSDFAITAQTFYTEAEERYQQRKYDVERPLLAPEMLFISADELAEKSARFTRINIANQDLDGSDQVNFGCQPVPDLTINAKLSEPAQALRQFIEQSKARVLFVAESAGHREALIDKLRPYKIALKPIESWSAFVATESSPHVLIAPMDHGLWLQQPALAIITESQLSGEKVQQRRRRRRASVRALENMVNNLNELTVGSPVVHQEHGVGRYLGLQILQIGGIDAEFLTLEYANNDKLYVPVSSLHVIGRYTGISPENAPLHKLGGDQWSKAKKKAIERIRDVAAELLEIHAKRAAKAGHAFDVEDTDYQAFADAFPFEETPDQQSAIEAILVDMASPQPMDRVICGDVGFGKTEVSMRAAFIAVQSGKQVAVLVPTTLLAQQHFQNFRDRFADWPVRIEVMSRFVSPKQQKEILDELEQGKVDIVIGTHKLLSNEIKYKALGLVVIDEEHRFGVRQKEHFKKLRNELDMLTLTATPIPRTLNMAMAGLRDISIIASPPPNRHAIKTFISEWVDAQVQEACLREIKRGGQVFFLHNDVKSMEKMTMELAALVPEARIEMAHGQMPERELERIMLDFYHQRFNILVCSTIIESGIDIPSANTIIINRADKLGLAQLHQLRGRVGRSHHRAYAYFMVPPKALISKDAVKRLEALEASGDLGAGFMLSSHDMEIRGAGELLGDEQSGQIQEIGFTLYTELLERAVSALKSGKQPELDAPMDRGPEVDLQASALIPEDYLPDIHARLVLYKRISSAENQQELRDLQVEMIDRFGLLPDPVKTLFSVAELKQQAESLGVKKIEANATGGRIIFTSTPNINADQLILLIQTQAQCYKFDGADKLRFINPFETVTQKLAFITELLKKLTPVGLEK